MGTALGGRQLDETWFGVCGGASDDWKGDWSLQFSVGFELRDGDGKERGSVWIIGFWDLVSYPLSEVCYGWSFRHCSFFWDFINEG